jgi:DNA repair exonuclease SbcCD ATPase subunit
MTTPKNMTNDQLFRALVNTQSAMKAELLKKIETVDKKLDKEVVGLKDEMKKGFKDINERLDMLGKQLNVLDEDAPTGEDFRNLEQRVTNLEIQNQNFVMA